MAEFKRFLARTEAWARVVEDDMEDVVTSSGRVTAFKGDVIVMQKLRGEDFVYVMTPDDFAEDWRSPDDVDTSVATSNSGTDELPGAVPPSQQEDGGDHEATSTDGENAVDNPPPTSAVPTAGTSLESPSPADAPPGDTAKDVTPQGTPTAPENVTDNEPAPATTASAPTGSGPGDAAQNVSTTDTATVGDGTEPGVSPISGPTTPIEPAEAPVGSAASEVSQEALLAPDVEAATPDQPDTTTPTQTTAPSQDTTGGAGDQPSDDAGADAVSVTPTGGGDEGNAPTPNVDNPDAVNTGNQEGKVRTLGTGNGPSNGPADKPATGTAPATPAAAPPDKGGHAPDGGNAPDAAPDPQSAASADNPPAP